MAALAISSPPAAVTPEREVLKSVSPASSPFNPPVTGNAQSPLTYDTTSATDSVVSRPRSSQMRTSGPVLLNPSIENSIRQPYPPTPDPSARTSYVSSITGNGTISPTTSVSISHIDFVGGPSNASNNGNVVQGTSSLDVRDQSTDTEGHRWQDFSPPEELQLFDSTVAVEIADVIKESMEKQWQIAKAEEEKLNQLTAYASTGPRRSESISGQSIRLPMLANEAVLEQEQPGLQVVEGQTFSPIDLTPSPTIRANKSKDLPSRPSMSTISSKGSGGKPGRTESISSSINSQKKASSSSTLVPVGPMGFMGYNRSNGIQERWVPEKPVSPWAEKLKKRKEKNNTAECINKCSGSFKNKDLVDVDCEHMYCKPCFHKFITTAMYDEKKFPPTCCGKKVPSKLAQAYLTKDQVKVYKQREKEFALPSNARFYCPSPLCSKWIDTSQRPLPKDAKSLKCPHCKSSMCTICRGAAHAEWQACDQDFAVEQKSATQKLSGDGGQGAWHQCSRCQTMVEIPPLVSYYVTCKCNSRLCYACGIIWRNCNCTEQDQLRKQQELQNLQMTSANEAVETALALEAVQRVQQQEAEMAEQEAQRQRLEEEQRQAAIQASVESKFTELATSLKTLHATQRQLMHARHEAEIQELLNEHTIANQQPASAAAEELRAALTHEHQNRAADIGMKHKQALEELDAAHQDNEDQTFISIMMQLRGKPNADARAKKMTEQVRRMQEVERADLQRTQEAEFTALLRRERAEVLNAEQAAAASRNAALMDQTNQRTLQARLFWAQGEWFDVIVAAREEMLERERKRQLDVGLADAKANGSLETVKVEDMPRPVHPLEFENRRIHNEYGVTY